MITTTLNCIQITPCLNSALKRLISDLKVKPRVPVVWNCLLNEKTYVTGLAYHALVTTHLSPFKTKTNMIIFKVACFFTRRRSIQWKVIQYKRLFQASTPIGHKQNNQNRTSSTFSERVQHKL